MPTDEHDASRTAPAPDRPATVRRTVPLVATPLLAAALLTTAVAAAPAAGARDGAGPGTRPAAPATTLDWKPCPGTGLDPRQECATLAVPLDHRRPYGEQISLGVSRIRSERPEARRGTLLLIPEGPGGSGINRPSTHGKKLPQSVRDAYDLVGFDPRGLDRSTPASCGLAHEDLSYANIRPWPDADGSLDRAVATGRRVAEQCARNGGELLRSISTRNEARDIDRIRQALGERKLSAWGVSYGTYAGAVYAQMFPHRTDRWVLDSSNDPDPTRVGRGWTANFAIGVEDAFPDFAAWAADPANEHRFVDDPAEVRPLFLRLAERLDREPVPWPGANPAVLNGDVLRQTLLSSLNAESRYPALAQLMRAARDGEPLPPAQTPQDEALQATFAVSAATICNDVSWPDDLAEYRRKVAESRRTHPLTAGMPEAPMVCAFWKDQPREKPVRITSDGPSNVLMIQNRRDAATPLAAGRKMRAAFGDRARMVVVDAAGHGSYTAVGNACGDRAVTDYLVHGERPATDLDCPAA
ncbi:alpha/beta fold hydrolase [Streptomyces pactum]|uniref:Alpha/beta fold hydrolase n=1 Tax=Streptomyces pactum TaxID=68249 RepID=A0ABS0NMH7_9ACTN|nr:alpha/beta hydrolase [Streptomyces pactum]MBH5336287.1 alpha/beta fold hydrolase [Streptomyces pactum]